MEILDGAARPSDGAAVHPAVVLQLASRVYCTRSLAARIMRRAVLVFSPGNFTINDQIWKWTTSNKNEEPILPWTNFLVVNLYCTIFDATTRLELCLGKQSCPVHINFARLFCINTIDSLTKRFFIAVRYLLHTDKLNVHAQRLPFCYAVRNCSRLFWDIIMCKVFRKIYV